MQGREDIRLVFNLKTSDGVYFANNVLVHNCDSLSQALNWFQDNQMLEVLVI